jgi:hypothetical protein
VWSKNGSGPSTPLPEHPEPDRPGPAQGIDRA